MNYPELSAVNVERLWTQEFLGIDRRPRTNDGAFIDTVGVTGAEWPVVKTREKHGTVAAAASGRTAIADLNGLAYTQGTTLYYNGQATSVTDLSSGDKNIVTFGAYLIVLPDGRYYNTVDPTDTGSINRLYQSPSGEDITFSPCTMNGIDFPAGHWTAAATPPSSPTAGDYWINTSVKPHALYQYSSLESDWVGVVSVFVKIAADGIGEGLAVGDAVTVSGITVSSSYPTMKEQLEVLNETHIIQAVDDDWIVVIGVVDEVYELSGRIRADRKMPELDYVFECNNRLWGCRYGTQDGETVNRIYATALGDFKNWRKFYGTSQDSYYVNVGTEGPFTGGIAHRGYPYFFKDNCVHKVYGDRPSNFEMQTTYCDGVKKGCGKSLTSANGVLYYMSNHGPVYFESMPALCGEALCRPSLSECVAGYCGGELFLSGKEGTNTYSTYVLDTARGVWYRRSGDAARGYATHDNEIYMLGSQGDIVALHGRAGTLPQAATGWTLETAVMGYEYPDHKYISRFVIRMMLETGATAAISIKYDTAGDWLQVGELTAGNTVRTYLVPVIPRRCEHVQIRLEGTGQMTLYGIARELRMGSDAMNRGVWTND